MAATTIVPLELYLQSSYEPDAEYVDGEIEERPMESSTIRPGRLPLLFGLGTTDRLEHLRST